MNFYARRLVIREPTASLICRHLSRTTRSYRGAENIMPDLSHPKWARREKLNIMNLMNKGKSGFRQKKRIPVASEENAQEMDVAKSGKRKRARPSEQLPSLKINQQREHDPEYGRLYESICRLPDTFALAAPSGTLKVPGRISWEKLDKLNIPLLSESELNQVKLLAESPSHQPSSNVATEASHATLTLSPEQKTPLNELVAKQLVDEEENRRNELVQKPIKEVRDVLYLNAKLGRVEEAQKAFNLLSSLSEKPGIHDWNTLMNAYANTNHLDEVKKIFSQLTADGTMVRADEYSYGILIKALAKRRKISEAFKTYELMKSNGLDPTLPIYTTLIQACKHVGDLNRAWTLFDYYRLRVGRMDNVIVDSVLDICAKQGQVERAMALYRDLLRTPVASDQTSALSEGAETLFVPTITTYNILIHACAKRKEFYRDMFDIVQQMQAAGVLPTRETYNYLLMGCATNADIQRAKAIWSEMLEKSVGSEGELTPNRTSYLFMLSTYSRVPSLVEDVWRRTTWREKMNRFDKKILEAKMGMANEERMAQGLKPLDINEWAISDDNYQTDQKMKLVGDNDPDLDEIRSYVLQDKTEEQRIEETKHEALGFFQALLNRFRKASPNEKETKISRKVENTLSVDLELSEHILNAYIDVLGAYHMTKEAMNVHDRLFPEFHLQPNGTTYVRLMFALTRNRINMKEIERQLDDMLAEDDTHSDRKDTDTNDDDAEAELTLNSAWKTFKAFEKYRRLKGFPDKWSDLEGKFSREKWQERGVSHQDRKNEYLIYKYMIRCLSEYNDLTQALKLLRTLIDRDHARITNALHLRPDTSAPLTKSKCNTHEIAVYAESPVQFRERDFLCLLNKARDVGNMPVLEQVQQLLQRASRDVNREQEKNLARLQRIQKRSKFMQKGVTQNIQ